MEQRRTYTEGAEGERIVTFAAEESALVVRYMNANGKRGSSFDMEFHRLSLVDAVALLRSALGDLETQLAFHMMRAERFALDAQAVAAEHAPTTEAEQ